jgi:hypothetical protein
MRRRVKTMKDAARNVLLICLGLIQRLGEMCEHETDPDGVIAKSLREDLGKTSRSFTGAEYVMLYSMVLSCVLKEGFSASRCFGLMYGPDTDAVRAGVEAQQLVALGVPFEGRYDAPFREAIQSHVADLRKNRAVNAAVVVAGIWDGGSQNELGAWTKAFDPTACPFGTAPHSSEKTADPIAEPAGVAIQPADPGAETAVLAKPPVLVQLNEAKEEGGSQSDDRSYAPGDFADLASLFGSSQEEISGQRRELSAAQEEVAQIEKILASKGFKPGERLQPALTKSDMELVRGLASRRERIAKLEESLSATEKLRRVAVPSPRLVPREA